MSWVDAFLETLYRHRPVDATFIGHHEHDGILPDASPEAIESMLAETRVLASRPAAEGESLDARVARGALDVHAWELESGYFLRGNPAWYTGEAIFGVFSLLLRDFAPLEERLECVEARLCAVPRFLDQASENVRSAPPGWIERASRECDGALAFLGDGLEHLPASPSLKEAAAVAAAAFERHRSSLGDLQPSDAWSCGPEAFDLLLRRGHFLDWSARDIAERAEEGLASSTEALDAGAPRFGENDFRDVLARLEDLHPPRERYHERYQELWDESRALALERRLVTWPDDPLDYVPRPAWSRSAAPHLYFLFYRSPAPLDALPRTEYLVAPVEPSMSAEDAERVLRATNDCVIKVNHVLHHGGIGHHVQNGHAARSRSPIGRIAAVDGAARIALFAGGTMAEGWACYATDLMAEAGFLTDLELYAEHHSKLRMAARAIVDVSLHTRGMSFQAAERFYTEKTAMSPKAARAEVTKNTMFPGAALIYLVGSTLIHELRSDVADEEDLQSFHDALLSYGSLPVALIAEEMRSAAKSRASTK